MKHYSLQKKVAKRQCQKFCTFLHTDPLWQIFGNNHFHGKNMSFWLRISDVNSVDLKKTKKIIKGQIFFQRSNLKAKGQKFYNFFSDLGQFTDNYSEKVIGLSKKATKAPKRPYNGRNPNLKKCKFADPNLLFQHRFGSSNVPQT